MSRTAALARPPALRTTTYSVQVSGQPKVWSMVSLDLLSRENPPYSSGMIRGSQQDTANSDQLAGHPYCMLTTFFAEEMLKFQPLGVRSTDR